MEQILINKLQSIVKVNERNIDYSIATVLIKYLDVIKTKTIIEVAKESNCAKASVVKFAKRLGLDGYKELIQRLYIEQNLLVPQVVFDQNANQQPENLLLDNYYNLITQNLEYIQNNFQNQIIEMANLIRTSKRIYLFGTGSNLYTLQIFANYLMKLDYFTNFSFDLKEQKKFAKNATEEDFCLILSYSGETPELVEIYNELVGSEANIAVISSNRESSMNSDKNLNLFVLKNENLNYKQRDSLISVLYMLMEVVYLLSVKSKLATY